MAWLNARKYIKGNGSLRSYFCAHGPYNVVSQCWARLPSLLVSYDLPHRARLTLSKQAAVLTHSITKLALPFQLYFYKVKLPSMLSKFFHHNRWTEVYDTSANIEGPVLRTYTFLYLSWLVRRFCCAIWRHEKYSVLFNSTSPALVSRAHSLTAL